MKRFNLLSDAWIPVKTRQGTNRPPIKAYEIVQKDIIGLDAPRADFNAALMQFLIGLLQTVLAPENPREWRKLFKEPPSEDELKRKFEEIEDAFYLDGDGCRFMQDPSIQKAEYLIPVEEIIFGGPGDNTKRRNIDHFVKNQNIKGLCFSCSALALLSANIFADNGGPSYFESIRGNGFISNLVCIDEKTVSGKEKNLEAVLWKNLMLNILPNEHFKGDLSKGCFLWNVDIPDTYKKREEFTYNIKELEKKIKSTIDKKTKKELMEEKKQAQSARKNLTTQYPESSHPMQVFWAWLRRFYLNIEHNDDEICSICNKYKVITKTVYKTNKGYNYPKHLWRHPFSPYKESSGGEYQGTFLPIEMTVLGLPYSYWNDFIVTTDKQFPAEVVNQHLKKQISSDSQLIIWSFGFAMDSNSPLGWYESKTPLYLLEDIRQKKAIEAEINRYIMASKKIADSFSGYLIAAVSTAWFDENKEKNREKKKSFYHERAIELARHFWKNTGNEFYRIIKDLYKKPDRLTDREKVKLRNEWYTYIKHEATNLFDRWAFKSKIESNPRRIAEAHNNLLRNLNSKTLKQEILGLPKED